MSNESIKPCPKDPAAAQFLPGGRCVLLWHTLPGGAAHVDWLCESSIDRDSDPTTPNPDSRSLIVFRLSKPLDALATSESMPAERLPDHRRLYLDYEGPIAGARGSVKRIARGELLDVAMTSADRARVQVRWRRTDASGMVVQTLDLTHHEGSRWLMHCAKRESAAE